MYEMTDRLSWRMSLKTWGNIMFKNYITEESGASAAEYALILAIVGAIIATSTIALRGEINTAIQNAKNNVNTANANNATV